jgi:hypothetical protein
MLSVLGAAAYRERVMSIESEATALPRTFRLWSHLGVRAQAESPRTAVA